MAGRVALVTGSTSGIGLGIARALASKGHSILLTGFGSEDVIQKHKEDFQRDFGMSVSHFDGDFSRPDEVDGLCREIRKSHPGGIDILVNNAGFQYVSPVDEFPLETWTSMMSVMLTAPFMLIKEFSPDMKSKGWGRIINISSTHGHVASVNKSAYVTAKHGILGLTKVVALEFARTGVTCNAVCPGYVSTELFVKQAEELVAKHKISFQEAKEVLLEKHPTRECATEEQIGEAVNFVCSSACDNMTGSSLVIDGGWTAV
ncbi:D-beta-hydroxybutyrate dehydrogenase-like [Diadema antillarum]|uniref:D-beta-hydroxybutyrate dehydrogenase-like n=1 Tax=Diadema antillarum TaxID=105358 RepID=UPI003A87B2AD